MLALLLALSTAPHPAASQAQGLLAIHVVSARGVRRRTEYVSSVAFELRTDEAPNRSVLLASGVSSERGDGTVYVKAFPLPREGSLGVRAWVVEEGMQSRTALLERRGEELYVRLDCQPGATARGRMLDSEDGPVPASLEVEDWSGPYGTRDWPRPSVELLPGGWFLVHASADVQGVLVAQNDRGAGAAEVTIPVADPPQDLLVVLRGAGVLRGRVVDPHGAPAGGLRIEVATTRLSDAFGYSSETALRNLTLESLGHTSRIVVTEADGSFEVPGLRAGDEYVVRACEEWSPSYFPLLLTAHPLPCDGLARDIVLDRPFLVVDVLDADGVRRTDGVRFEWQELEGGGVWPEDVSVRVLGSRGPGGLASAVGQATHSLGVPATYVLRPGRCYWVGATGGGFDGTFQPIEAPDTGGRIDVALRPRDTGAKQAVRVRARPLGDAPLGGAVSYRLEDVASGASLLRHDRIPVGEDVTFVAPPGSYRVVAEGTPRRAPRVDDPEVPRSHGRVEARIDVRERTDGVIELDLPVGGRLEVHVADAPMSADFDWGPLREFPPRWERERLPIEPHAARIELHATDRYPETVLHLGAWRSSFHPTDWLFGEVGTSHVLPAGTYELVAVTSDGREFRTPVTVRAGETTPVDVVF